MIQAGLVLEGGGMKGIYTAGVLDFFMEKDLYFNKRGRLHQTGSFQSWYFEAAISEISKGI